MQTKEVQPRKETGLKKLVVVELEPRHIEWIQEAAARGNGSFQDILSTAIQRGVLLLDEKGSSQVLDSAFLLKGKMVRVMKRGCVLDSGTYSKLNDLASGSNEESAMAALLTFVLDTSYLVQKSGQTKVEPRKIDKTPVPIVETGQKSKELIIFLLEARVQDLRLKEEEIKRDASEIAQSLTGQEFRLIREVLGITQQEFAYEAGRSRGLVFEIEKGRGSIGAFGELVEVLLRLVEEKFAKEQKSVV